MMTKPHVRLHVRYHEAQGITYGPQWSAAMWQPIDWQGKALRRYVTPWHHAPDAALHVLAQRWSSALGHTNY
jgi:hypothetical protein